MSVIETRLTERQATLAGITRVIHQQLGRTPLARIELRYSTQARVPLLAQDAKQKIAALLRDHGQGTATISVRPHEGPIDDATGEHVLRLTPAVRAPEAAAAAVDDAPARGWRAWLPSWPRLRRRASAGSARVEPGLHQARPQPSVDRTQAVLMLRQAVHKSSGYVESETGTGIVAQGRAGTTSVGKAVVFVRLARLHQVLEPLVKQDPAAIGAMVRSAGLALTPGFEVAYRFEPSQAGDGTSYANESDVEVRLIGASPHDAAAARPDGQTVAAPAPALTSRQAPVVAPVAARGTTALPVLAGGTALPATPEPTVTVRVLGTLDRPFDKPFELIFLSLPARLDRQALERAGFGTAHPGLLPVASNSCPLLIRGTTDGALRVHACVRTPAGSGREPTPMYFRRRDLCALTGEVTLAAGADEQIVVNAPGGAVCPDTGRRLPALVIEVRPGGWPGRDAAPSTGCAAAQARGAGDAPPHHGSATIGP